MNQKITIIIIVFVIVIGIGLVFVSKSNDNQVSDATASVVNASLVAEVGQYDFGEIDIFGGKVTTEFLFTNTGEEAIVIIDGTTSCACTSAEIDNVAFDMHNGMKSTVTIEPGETKTVLAIYDPLFHGPNGVGKITREIILKTNSVVTPEVRARFTADVTKN